MKKTILSIIVCVAFGAMFTSCNSYDRKKSEKLAEKVDDNDLKSNDYIELIEQLDGLLDMNEKTITEIQEMESKSDRCDKFDDFKDSDECEYMVKFYYSLEHAKEEGDLKGDAKDKFSNIEAKSRFRKIEKAYDKLRKKCRDND